MVDIPFGFIIKRDMENFSNGDSNTQISLSSNRWQVSFRSISDQRLKRLLNNYEFPIILAVKLVLGNGYLSSEEFPRDNTSITSRFVASLLDNQVPKMKVNALALHLFNQGDLLGIELVLNHAILGIGMPRPKDLILFSMPGEVITYYPFLLDLNGAELRQQRAYAAMAIRFLEWKFLGEDLDCKDWEEELINFARINGFLPMKFEHHVWYTSERRCGEASGRECGPNDNQV